MKIVDETTERSLTKVWVSLTRDELVTLYEHLRAHLEEGDDDPGWHMHIEAKPEDLILTVGSSE